MLARETGAAQTQRGVGVLQSSVDARRSVLEAGQVVGGKYELIRWLASGSMGDVWVARHRTLNEDVALKLLAPHEDVERASMDADRFRLEARIAARLSTRTAQGPAPSRRARSAVIPRA